MKKWKTACLFLGILIPVTLLGQHNNRSARELQFRFGNPGARSLGFGGAFIGLADDATAPMANPAGMTRTSKRSLSLEFNYTRMENEIPYQSGSVIQRNLFEFDFELEQSRAPDDVFQVPYLAVVFPKGRFPYGFFAHQQANLNREYSTDAVLICDFSSGFHPNCPNTPDTPQYPPSTDVLDLEIVNVGFSGAWLFGEQFSIGGSVFYSDMDYQADSFMEFPLVGRMASVNRLARGEDADWGGFVGVLWQAADELSLGMVYKRQPEFVYTAQLVKSEPVPLFPEDFTKEGIFKIPDSIGFGLSIQAAENLTINLDANRVYYSQISDHLIDFTEASTGGGNAIIQVMPDVTELHAGLEWVFTGTANPISLRLGYWFDPYHAATNNVEDNQILEGPIDKPFFRDIMFLHLFEKDQHHYSMGLGWTVGQKFQFDMAYETSSRSDIATISGIYRF